MSPPDWFWWAVLAYVVGNCAVSVIALVVAVIRRWVQSND